ncbi:MAG: type II toxin-antitoxin system RatA family toxin [Candidatus Zipacnadales bacterium]
MPEIHVTVTIEAPLDQVYGLAKQIERLPEFDANLESVRIIERAGTRVVSEWVGVVKEFGQKVRWTEEDLWNDELHRCTFVMTKGDFDRYKGSWEFSAEANDRTRVDLRLEYEYNVPLIGPLIKNLLHKKTQESALGIMNALKALAETGPEQ